MLVAERAPVANKQHFWFHLKGGRVVYELEHLWGVFELLQFALFGYTFTRTNL